MNWYKEYQAEWKEIIETVAREKELIIEIAENLGLVLSNSEEIKSQ